MKVSQCDSSLSRDIYTNPSLPSSPSSLSFVSETHDGGTCRITHLDLQKHDHRHLNPQTAVTDTLTCQSSNCRIPNEQDEQLAESRHASGDAPAPNTDPSQALHHILQDGNIHAFFIMTRTCQAECLEAKSFTSRIESRTTTGC